MRRGGKSVSGGGGSERSDLGGGGRWGLPPCHRPLRFYFVHGAIKPDKPAEPEATDRIFERHRGGVMDNCQGPIAIGWLLVIIYLIYLIFYDLIFAVASPGVPHVFIVEN